MDGEQTVEVQAVEAEAKEMGWVPQEEYKGDPARWVDATTYVERGQTVMPILKANNQKLLREVTDLKGKLDQLLEAQRASQETITALQAQSIETAKQAFQRGMATLKARKADALKEGDTEEVVEIDEAIAALRGKEPKAAEPKTSTVNPTDFSQQPFFQEWKARNEWVDVDKRKSAYALGVAQEAHAKGLRDKEILDYVDEVLARDYPGAAPARKVDKMEGGKGGGGTPSGRATNGKTYADLPADVKATCDRFSRMLVGKGKMYETVEAHRKSYVQQYFAE
jgi:hypothetical protein